MYVAPVPNVHLTHAITHHNPKGGNQMSIEMIPIGMILFMTFLVILFVIGFIVISSEHKSD